MQKQGMDEMERAQHHDIPRQLEEYSSTRKILHVCGLILPSQYQPEFYIFLHIYKYFTYQMWNALIVDLFVGLLNTK